MMPKVGSERRVLLGAATLVILLLSAPRWNLVPPRDSVVIDHHTYQVAIHGVRTGDGYYSSYSQGFRDAYGPLPSVRDVRPPLLYLLLAALPAGSEWRAYVAMSAGAGLLVAAAASLPLVGVVATAYLLTLAVVETGDGAASQYLYAEFWAAGLVAVSILLLRRGRWLLALWLAVLTFLIREQAVILVAGIGTAMWLRKSHRPQVVAALLACLTAYGLHIAFTLPHLDPVNGTHTPLHLGWPPLSSLNRTLGFGVSPAVIGWVAWMGAVVWARHHRLLMPLAPWLALPLLALYVNRPYWGILTVPVFLVLAIDFAFEFGRSLLVPTPPRTPPPLVRGHVKVLAGGQEGSSRW